MTETVTGSDGGYRFDGVPLGEYTLAVTMPDDTEPVHSQTVDVGSEPIKTVDPIVVATERGLYLPSIRR